jgi:hypothetical protein
MQAGVEGGPAYREQLMELMHVVPGVGLTCAFAVPLYDLIARKKDGTKE